MLPAVNVSWFELTAAAAAVVFLALMGWLGR